MDEYLLEKDLATMEGHQRLTKADTGMLGNLHDSLSSPALFLMMAKDYTNEKVISTQIKS